MIKNNIIRMAREVADTSTDRNGRVEFIFDNYGLENFANLVAAAEREACAKVCEAEGERVDASWVSCAAAIRARGQE